MAGGGGKPLNIFKVNRGVDPPQAFNWRLWFAVFSFGIMGAARGKQFADLFLCLQSLLMDLCERRRR